MIQFCGYNIFLLLIILLIGLVYGFPQSYDIPVIGDDQLAEPSDETVSHQQYESTAESNSKLLASPLDSDDADPEVGSQRFFPLFSRIYNNGNPPLGHSRPFVYNNQEGAYSHRPTYSARQQTLNYEPNFRGFDNEFERSSSSTTGGSKSKPLRTTATHGLLGSGNFGVIRGGTFYNENDDQSELAAGSSHSLFNPFYQNGHGRPASYYFNPKPTKHEQFANFRDFADINTPSNSAYSQFVIVYANKNQTNQANSIFEPKNINERLAMLDEELGTADEMPVKKLSKSKMKLAKLLPEKKPWSKKLKLIQKDLYEPLLALS